MPVMLLKVFTWVFFKVQMADVWRQMAHPPAKFMPDMDPFGISARHWDVATMTILTLWNGRFLVGQMLFFRPVLLIRKLALEPGLIPPLVMRMVLPATSRKAGQSHSRKSPAMRSSAKP